MDATDWFTGRPSSL